MAMTLSIHLRLHLLSLQGASQPKDASLSVAPVQRGCHTGMRQPLLKVPLLRLWLHTMCLRLHHSLRLRQRRQFHVRLRCNHQWLLTIQPAIRWCNNISTHQD